MLKRLFGRSAPEVKDEDGRISLPNCCIFDKPQKDLIQALGPDFCIDTTWNKPEMNLRKAVLKILPKIKRTFVCIKYKGLQAKPGIIINPDDIDKETLIIRLHFEKNLNMKLLNNLVSEGAEASMHLVDGILVGTIYFDIDKNPVFKPVRYVRDCIHARRKSRRIELIDKTESVYMEDEHIGYIDNLSEEGIGFVVPFGIAQKLFKEKKFFIKLPFLSQNIGVEIKKSQPAKDGTMLGAQITVITKQCKKELKDFLRKQEIQRSQRIK